MAEIDSHYDALNKVRLENLTAHQGRLFQLGENTLILGQAVVAAAVKQIIEFDLTESMSAKHGLTGNVPAESQIASKNAGNTPPVTPPEVFTRDSA